VGTGFYVEKVTDPPSCESGFIRLNRALQDVKSAAEFYEGKVKELGVNIQNLETIVQNKSSSLRVVEEGEPLRQVRFLRVGDMLT